MLSLPRIIEIFYVQMSHYYSCKYLWNIYLKIDIQYTSSGAKRQSIQEISCVRLNVSGASVKISRPIFLA